MGKDTKNLLKRQQRLCETGIHPKRMFQMYWTCILTKQTASNLVGMLVITSLAFYSFFYEV